MASANKRTRVGKTATAFTKAAVVPANTFQRYSDNNRTHEGGFAQIISDEAMLRRAVTTCFLWEDQFYESGKDIADRICELIPKCDPQFVFDLAVETKTVMKLRHVPLLIAAEMPKYPEHKKLVRRLCHKVLTRPDDAVELVTIYWRDVLEPVRTSEGNFVSQRAARPLPMQVKRGISDMFPRMDQYQITKHQEKGKLVTLGNIIRMVRPNPSLATKQSKSITTPMSEVYSGVIMGTANAPDTWNVELSARGKGEKKEVFTEQLVEKKLGATALLMNLRNMIEAGVDQTLVRDALANINVEKILPFRFITAARYAPSYKPELQAAMFKCIDGIEKLPGRTILLVDISSSMTSVLSRRKDGRPSDLRRIDAATGLCVLAQNVCENAQIYLFDTGTFKVTDKSIVQVHQSTQRGWYSEQRSARRSYTSSLVGFELAEAVSNLASGGTDLAQAVTYINQNEAYDRLIIFTDDESSTTPESPKSGAIGYSINVASGAYGVTYGDFNHISGFSEGIIHYITEYEKLLSVRT